MKKKIKKPVIKVESRYILPTGYNSFRFVTIYTDYTVSVGSEQKIDNKEMMRLYVPVSLS